MGGRRAKKTYQKQRFESTGVHGDVSSNLYESMLLSSAWKNLTKPQQNLYMYCKLQYYAERKKPNGEPDCFTFNAGKWKERYEIYHAGNERAFYRDMNALIQHGFIACVERGANTRTKSIYRYSDRWRQFGTAAFEVPHNEKTDALINAEKKAGKGGAYG